MHPIDRLDVAGIDSKGYGRIYKAVMRDSRIHIMAKCIYAYFCAYAGNGNCAFPKRDKIIRDLRMNKDTYTKYLTQLTDAGYIEKRRTQTGNRYTINLQVPEVGETETGIPWDTSILTSRTIKAHGFGTVPKLVMLDARLSAQAKAIYSYFCSFAGAGTVAFPHKATIHRELAISPRTYYLHFASLTGFGYITTRQRKNAGRYDVSEYILNETVEPVQPEEPGQGSSTTGPMSEILQSGKLQSGGKPAENTPMSEISQSGKPQSDKVMSGKMVHQNIGQPYITTNTSINNSSYKEQDYNHQADRGGFSTSVARAGKEDILHALDRPHLESEMRAWVKMKDSILGHFPSPEDRSRYEKRAAQILDELVRQILERSNEPDACKRIIGAASEGAFYDLYFDLADRGDQMRSIKRYVGTTLSNLIG